MIGAGPAISLDDALERVRAVYAEYAKAESTNDQADADALRNGVLKQWVELSREVIAAQLHRRYADAAALPTIFEPAARPENVQISSQPVSVARLYNEPEFAERYVRQCARAAVDLGPLLPGGEGNALATSLILGNRGTPTWLVSPHRSDDFTGFLQVNLIYAIYYTQAYCDLPTREDAADKVLGDGRFSGVTWDALKKARDRKYNIAADTGRETGLADRANKRPYAPLPVGLDLDTLSDTAAHIRNRDNPGNRKARRRTDTIQRQQEKRARKTTSSRAL
jgi:hypothetical protein